MRRSLVSPIAGGLVLLFGTLAALPAPAFAGEADVERVEVVKTGEQHRVTVTVRHADEGWDHYADQWRVVAPDGTALGTRTLHHPHETEQPFTRSLGGVTIPAEVSEVTIEARDNVHGQGGKTMTVQVPR